MGAMATETPESHITRVYERYGCLFVEGKVNKGTGQWLTAKATVHKSDVEHMTDQQFREFMVRRLPELTVEDNDFNLMARQWL